VRQPRQFLRAFEGVPQIVPKSHKFPYVVLDFLQFLTENLFDLVQGKPERLRLSDEAKPVNGFSSVYPVACEGSVGGRQETKSLVIADGLHTNARPFGYLPDKRCLFHTDQA
jgi:hypothetical protein